MGVVDTLRLEAGNMRTKTERLKWLGIFMAALVLPGLVLAQDIGAPDPEVIGELYPGRTYSCIRWSG